MSGSLEERTSLITCSALLCSSLCTTGGEAHIVECLRMWHVSSDAECIHPPLLMMGDSNVWFAGGKNHTCCVQSRFVDHLSCLIWLQVSFVNFSHQETAHDLHLNGWFGHLSALSCWLLFQCLPRPTLIANHSASKST